MVSSAVRSSFVEDDFELPSGGAASGKFLNPSKLPDGQPYRLRIVSDKSVKGWEYWTQDNKPKRLPYGKNLPNYGRPTSDPADIRRDDQGKADRVKFFWAFTVWDYQDSEIKVFSATQASIHEALLTLIRDEDWGHPTGYDIKITRSGKGLETSYAIAPGKASDIPADAAAAYAEKPVNLDALISGGDPFAPGGEGATSTSPTASIESRMAAIAELQDLARQAKLDTAGKLKAFLAEYDFAFTSFDALSEDAARYCADLIAANLDIPF